MLDSFYAFLFYAGFVTFIVGVLTIPHKHRESLDRGARATHT